MSAIKGEAVIVDRRRRWASPIDASLFANAVSRPTFDAMQARSTTPSRDFRRWLRAKARLHGHAGGLPWWDLVAPAPVGAPDVSWDAGVADGPRAPSPATTPTSAGSSTGRSPTAGSTPSRATASAAAPSAWRSPATARSSCSTGRQVGTRCTRTVAHELGHAPTTPRWRARSRAAATPADGARRDGQHLLRDARRRRRASPAPTAATASPCSMPTCRPRHQVVVDIRSRFLFEHAVFARRQRRTLGIAELDELMLAAQAEALRATASTRPRRYTHMWIVKPHYAAAKLYNWPVHLRPAVRARLVQPLPRRPRSASGTATRTCCRAPAWTPRRTSAPGSASTSPTRRSGRRASTSCAPASTSTPASSTSTAGTRDRHPLRRRPRRAGGLLTGEPRYRVHQVWQGLYERFARPDEMTNLPRALRERLADELPRGLVAVTESVSDQGDTVKFLWGLAERCPGRDGP